MSKIEHHKASKDELHVSFPFNPKPTVMHSWGEKGDKLTFHSASPQGTFEDSPPVQLMFSKEEPTALVIGTTEKVSEAQAAQFLEVIRRWDAHDDLVKALKAINDFWSDVAENQKSGACLSPSALLLDNDTPIAVAVSAALAKAGQP